MNKSAEPNKPANPKKQNYDFQTEVGALLGLLANSLYSNREIFLRELISNSADALAKVKFKSLTDSDLLAVDEVLKIQITLDEKNKKLTISDNGIGMTKQELIKNLGTIAKSGTGQFLKKISQQKDALDFIGKFGVGFYSVFMVTSEVTVDTLSIADKKQSGHRWTSRGKGSFSIEPIKKETMGTSISFVFNDASKSLATKWVIERVIKQHSNFVPFAIEFDNKQINRKEALWVKPKSQITKPEYQDLFKYLSHQDAEPRFIYHYTSDAPLQFNSILYTPIEADPSFFQSQATSHIQLYSRKIFIQDDCKELFPAWLRFMYGVVDSHDLPLNISRQSLQETPILTKIKNFLVKKLIQEWQTLKEKEPQKFYEFWENFGIFIKEGIYSDFSQRNSLISLYHAHTSADKDKLVSLKEYVARMPDTQKEIYYVQGKNHSQIEALPNLEYFKRHNIEVLYLYEDFDEFVINSINSFEEKPIISVDKAEVKIDQPAPKDEKDTQPTKSDTTKLSAANIQKLKGYFKDILGDNIEDVLESQRLIDSPCTLVSKKGAPTAGMEKIMKMMNKDFSETKKILEVNFDHPIIKNLSNIQKRFPQEPLIKETVELLYNNCLTIERNLGHDSLVFPKINRLLEKTTSLYLNSLGNPKETNKK